MSTLDQLRTDIDRIDEVLVRLLNERARVACEVGRLKKAQGIDVKDRGRVPAELVVKFKAATAK